LHQRLGVPHLDLLSADPHLDVFPDQTRRHGIGVVPHLDRAPTLHPCPPAFPALQPPRRQRTQCGQLDRERSVPPRIPPLHQFPQERFVLRPAGEIPAAPQQQRLRHRLLEPPVALLAIAVLMSARRIGRFPRQPVVRQ